MDSGQINRPSVLPWLVCSTLHASEVSTGNKTYRFFAEDIKEGEHHAIELLPLEFFNQELMKVDTTSELSLLRFCEKWGLLLSPLYASKTHALSGRKASNDLAYGYYYPTSYRDGIAALEGQLAADIEAFRGSCGFETADEAVQQLIGSEFAREAVAKGDYGDPSHFGAVVSVDEVAYTVRLLQIACGILAAHQSGLRGQELHYYLLNDNVIPRKHPIELETRLGFDLLFGDYLAAAQQIELAKGSGTEVDKERIRVVGNVYMEMGVENARSFIRQATINLALENIWMREDGDKLEGEGFWGEPLQVMEGSLLEAILTNFDYVMNAPFDWSTCEHCGRVFKFQKEYDPANRYRKSMFCRDSCRVRSAQIKRNNAAHGLGNQSIEKAMNDLSPDGYEPEGLR
ncbi:MAG: hypothetical protein FWD27_02135 [Coriobacteriia bacterium]|nr:hypothetical protein [Coriobacteriia bacterium]